MADFAVFFELVDPVSREASEVDAEIGTNLGD